MKINENLKELRKNLNLLQKDIANKLQITVSAYSAWELGRNEPKSDDLIKLADIFGCSVDYILGREKEDGTLVIMGNQLSNDEEKLIDKLRTFDNMDKNIIYKMVDTIYSKNQK